MLREQGNEKVLRSDERINERNEERDNKRRRMADGNQEKAARGGVEAEETTTFMDIGNANMFLDTGHKANNTNTFLDPGHKLDNTNTFLDTRHKADNRRDNGGDDEMINSITVESIANQVIDMTVWDFGESETIKEAVRVVENR